MGILSPLHWLLLLLVVLLLFGPRWLGHLGKRLGTNVRELKNVVSGDSKRK